MESAPAAMARAPIAGPRARKMVPGRKCPTIARAATGAGGCAFRMHPGGAITRTGRKLPSLLGTSGPIAALIAKVVQAAVSFRGTLIPRWGRPNVVARD